MKKIIPFLICLCAAVQVTQAQILPSFGDSRTGTTGLQFLKVAPDARSAGMAGSYIAVVNDPSALYWNPAGIAKVDTQKYHFIAGHTEYFADVKLQHAAAVRRIGGDTYIGVSLVYLNTGDMPVTTEFQPFGTGQTFNAVDMALGLSLARTLTDNFRFGVTGKYVYEGIADVRTDALVFDFGFQYDIGLANTRFAVSVANFGFNTTPSGEIEVIDLTGNKVITNFEQISVPAIFRLGLAWDAIKQEQHNLTFAAQLNHPTDNNETFGIGTEYSWHRILYARAGYEFGADETGLPAFGFGLNLARRFGAIRFDYGFNNKKQLGTTHRLTVGFSLL